MLMKCRMKEINAKKEKTQKMIYGEYYTLHTVLQNSLE
jgi:hypothetical protein